MTQTVYNNQSRSIESVFFLGAGASVWSGVPTFSNFHEKAEYVCKHKLFDDDPKKEIFQRVLKHWRSRYNNYNLEEYYAVIEMDERLKLNHTNIEDSDSITANDIVTVISNTIQKSLAITKSQIYYDKLIFILQMTIPDSIIITTNWDILLEDVIYRKAGQINYEGIHGYDTLPNKDGVYDILKLHGSLNWGFCKKCGEICYTDAPKCDILISSPEGLKCKICKEKLEPVIVPPTSSKLAQAETKTKYAQLVPIWNSAYKHLKLCEKIYFIGYSLPETDVETRKFISEALRGNSNLKEIIIISDQKYGRSRFDFEERYHSIISKVGSNPAVEFIYNGFERFCDTKIDQFKKEHGRY